MHFTNFNISDGPIYNLRKELARLVYKVRRGAIDPTEANLNATTLVALCPDGIISRASMLKHQVMFQVNQWHLRQLVREIANTDDGRKIKLDRPPQTRIYIKPVKLPRGMIG